MTASLTMIFILSCFWCGTVQLGGAKYAIDTCRRAIWLMPWPVQRRHFVAFSEYLDTYAWRIAFQVSCSVSILRSRRNSCSEQFDADIIMWRFDGLPFVAGNVYILLATFIRRTMEIICSEIIMKSSITAEPDGLCFRNIGRASAIAWNWWWIMLMMSANAPRRLKS